LCAAAPHQPLAEVPSSYGIVPAALSTWGNTRYGDCVSAEEAAAKAVWSVLAGCPELVIADSTLIAWARKHGFLNGADLTSVMDAMIKDGITGPDGKTYRDGPYSSVDWTDDAVLSSAIYSGPVKIGVAAGQLEDVVTPGTNGWLLTGAKTDQNLDHCVGLCGYGAVAELFGLLKLPVPSGANASSRAYLLFTWGTIGVIDRSSLLAICGEAWLRIPTTPEQPLPAPVPTPTPTPTPSTGVITIDLASSTISAPSGWSLVPTP
jgi:hypothetical protein